MGFPLSLLVWLLAGAGGTDCVPRRSALHFVAATGNLACTKLLVDAGADLNLGDKDGAPLPSWAPARWLVQARAAALRMLGLAHNRQEVAAATWHLAVPSRAQQCGVTLACLHSTCSHALGT